jgi:lipocalin
MGSAKSKIPDLAATQMPVLGGAHSLMGYWYVASVIPTYFEKGASNCLEHYEWTNKEEEKLKVTFKYKSSATQKKPSVIFQDGRVVNKETGTEWTVRPRLFNGNLPLPLWLPYIIIDHRLVVEPEKTYLVVGMPDRSYLWIMFRSPHVDPALVEELQQKCVDQFGYEKKNMKLVPQTWEEDYPRTDPKEWMAAECKN